MKKCFTIGIAFFFITACQLSQNSADQNQAGRIAKESTFSSSTKINSSSAAELTACTTWREDHTLDRWSQPLAIALGSTKIYSIGGACELSDGTAWVSALFDDEQIGAIIVHLDKNGTLMQKLEGYSAFFGDKGACGFENIQGNRIFVLCESGIDGRVIALNTRTDERTILSTSEHGANFGAHDSPFAGFSCSADFTDGCSRYTATEHMDEAILSGLNEKNIVTGDPLIITGDTCKLSPSLVAVAYTISGGKLAYGSANANGVALVETNGKLIDFAEDGGMAKLGPPSFSCASGSIAIFVNKNSNFEEETHMQTFVAGLAEIKVDLIDATHSWKNPKPCDSEGCF